jgi:hypothetical protein
MARKVKKPASPYANMSGGKTAEDSPGWNAATMGNRTGWHKGVYYVDGKPARDTRNYRKRAG